MVLKKMMCMILVCMLTVGTITIPAQATETAILPSDTLIVNLRATRDFDVTIPAKTKVITSNILSLAAGETVTIKASYYPFSASVDFGLVDSDGVFYCINVTGGSIDETIQVNESGSYRLQIRNNANVEVEVSGFVNY